MNIPKIEKITFIDSNITVYKVSPSDILSIGGRTYSFNEDVEFDFLPYQKTTTGFHKYLCNSVHTHGQYVFKVKYAQKYKGLGICKLEFFDEYNNQILAEKLAKKPLFGSIKNISKDFSYYNISLSTLLKFYQFLVSKEIEKIFNMSPNDYIIYTLSPHVRIKISKAYSNSKDLGKILKLSVLVDVFIETKSIFDYNCRTFYDIVVNTHHITKQNREMFLDNIKILKEVIKNDELT